MEDETIDYKGLLKSYMRMHLEQEGDMFAPEDLTVYAGEIDALVNLQDEVRDEQPDRWRARDE